eukprot:scaffold41172_cov54-Phaeocystis_antarctica.AAC.3
MTTTTSTLPPAPSPTRPASPPRPYLRRRGDHPRLAAAASRRRARTSPTCTSTGAPYTSPCRRRSSRMATTCCRPSTCASPSTPCLTPPIPTVADRLGRRLPAVGHQPERAPVRLAWRRLPAVVDRLE